MLCARGAVSETHRNMSCVLFVSKPVSDANRAGVRFQSLIQKQLSLGQCAMHHCARHGGPESASVEIRVCQDARIAGNIRPRTIARYREKQ